MKSIGRKARSLEFLRGLGLAVPHFETLDSLDEREFRGAGQLTPRLVDKLSWIWHRFGGRPLAVHPSGTADIPDPSQCSRVLRSFLDVRTEEELRTTVTRCWLAVSASRSALSSDSNAIHLAHFRLGIVIQEFVEPEWSGCAFSVHPSRGRDDQMLIKARRGRRERTFDEDATPGQWIVPWQGELANLEIEDPENLRIPETLLRELRDQVRKIHCERGQPQKVSFAVRDGRFYFLDARNLDRIDFAPELGEWSTRDLRDGSVSAGTISPLRWSLYEKALLGSLPPYLVKIGALTDAQARRIRWCRVFYGRPYWNVGETRKALARLSLINKNNLPAARNFFSHGHRLSWRARLADRFRLVLSRLFAEAEHRTQLRRCEGAIKDANRIETHLRRLPIASLDQEEFTRELVRLFDEQNRIEIEYFRTMFEAARAQREFFRDFNHRKGPDETATDWPPWGFPSSDEDSPTRDLTLVAERWNSDPGARMSLVAWLHGPGPWGPGQLRAIPAALREDLQRFARKYDFRCECDSDLRAPRWGEDLRFPVRSLLALMAGSTKIFSRFLPVNAEAPAIWLESRTVLLGQLSRKMKPKFARATELFSQQEALRERSLRLMYFVRLFVLELARRKSLIGDPFSLTDFEVRALVENRVTLADVQRNLNERSTYVTAYSRFPAPNEISCQTPFTRHSAPAVRDATPANAGVAILGSTKRLVRLNE